MQQPNCRINVEEALIANAHQRFFIIDIWLKMKVEPTYFDQRFLNVKMRLFFMR